MPSAHPSANPYRNRSIADQARDDMLLTLICRGCNRRANFWAADLVKVLPERHQAHIPPFGCSRCGTREWVDYLWSKPSAEQLQGGLTVRRPVRQVVRWLWQDERT